VVAEKDNPGFDAVVGNPPYVRVRTLRATDDDAVPYYESGEYRCATHVWDVYMLIVEKALRTARIGGGCGFIVPIQTLHQPNCAALRRYVLRERALAEVVDLSDLRVFEEAIVKYSWNIRRLLKYSKIAFQQRGVFLLMVKNLW